MLPWSSGRARPLCAWQDSQMRAMHCSGFSPTRCAASASASGRIFCTTCEAGVGGGFDAPLSPEAAGVAGVLGEAAELGVRRLRSPAEPGVATPGVEMAGIGITVGSYRWISACILSNADRSLSSSIMVLCLARSLRRYLVSEPSLQLWKYATTALHTKRNTGKTTAGAILIARSSLVNASFGDLAACTARRRRGSISMAMYTVAALWNLSFLAFLLVIRSSSLLLSLSRRSRARS
mmetsp:Transcript_36432/g.114962  ORF Transcript_36432/g.114962 Transcript_36432/m.114962 type:complete len:236 (+) Transcript_36432:90-797(+)